MHNRGYDFNDHNVVIGATYRLLLATAILPTLEEGGVGQSRGAM